MAKPQNLPLPASLHAIRPPRPNSRL